MMLGRMPNRPLRERGRARYPDPPVGSLVAGTAVTFGRMGFGRIGADIASAYAGQGTTSAPHLFAPGAFDSCLEGVRDGSWNVRLLVGHNPDRELASTEDGSLILGADERALGFVLNTRLDRGRLAARFVRNNPRLRQVSIGGNYEPVWTALIAGRAPAFAILQFLLREISVVEFAGRPGTKVIFEPNE